MAGRNQFDDDAFRALLKDSLQDIEVSAPLRERTLEACRRAMEASSESGNHDAVADAAHLIMASTQPLAGDATPPAGRVLSFLGRHRNLLRTAAGLAACLLVAVFAIEFLPRMGSRQAASLAMHDRAGAAQENAASSAAAAAAPEAAFAQPAPESGQAKMAGADYGADAATTSDAMTESPVAADVAAESTVAGTEGSAATTGARLATPAPAPGGSGEASASPEISVAFTESVSPDTTVTMQFSAALKTWMPYGGGLWVTPLPPSPDDASAADAARAYERTHPEQRVDPSARFGVLHLAQPLSAEGLTVAVSLKALLAEGTDAAGKSGPAGLWMMPADLPDGKGLVPLFVNNDGLGTSDAVRVGDQDGWFGTLRDEGKLRAALKAACGEAVDAWTVVDVDGGAGFWIGWTAHGTEWIMPLMDRAAELGLENGRGYAWDALVATVVPFL